MTTKWSSSQASIEHLTLRYRGTAADAHVPTLRLRVERLLRNVDLQPSGLPPGALLIVRKLHSSQDPVPLSTSALPESTQWAAHLQTQIAALHRTAARPALNPVSPNVASVLFADAAEMLACLTRDLLDGRIWQRWYWQQMLRNVAPTPAAALTALWTEQATFVPAMLNYLSIEEAQAAIALLTPTDVSQLISTLNSSFDLPSPSPATQPSNPSSAASSLQPNLPAVQRAPKEMSPPWQRWLSSSSATTLTALTPQAQYLLGFIVTLHHAPTFARSTSFITQSISWLDNQFLNPPLNETSQEGSSSIVGIRTGVIDDAPVPVIDDHAPVIRTGVIDDAPVPLIDPALVIDHAPLLRTGVIDDAPVPSHNLPPTLVHMGPIHCAQPFPAEGIPTALGGILYLINLLTWLDLPQAWTADGTFAEHLSSWALVEALARGLLGTAYANYADDPIWGILATLDNREPGTLIGADLPPQTVFRLPATWLQRYGPPNPSWIAATDGSRLQLIDKDASYLIVDVPLLERSLDEAIATEVNAYRAQGLSFGGNSDIATVPLIDPAPVIDHAPLLRTGVIDDAPSPSHNLPLTLVHMGDHPTSFISENTLWWLQRVLGFVHHLLIHALNDPTIDTNSLAENLLCKRGHLVAGRTHIDLYMPMDQISLPIRRAGLDRDPSWVPNLGRIVLFHFGQET